jgi:hypothetical protein
MKTISSDLAFRISREVRDILNRYEATAGSDAVLLCFAGDVDGMKLAHIKINNPPDMLETIGALIQYMLAHAHSVGVEAGIEKALNIALSTAGDAEKDPPKM